MRLKSVKLVTEQLTGFLVVLGVSGLGRKLHVIAERFHFTTNFRESFKNEIFSSFAHFKILKILNGRLSVSSSVQN